MRRYLVALLAFLFTLGLAAQETKKTETKAGETKTAAAPKKGSTAAKAGGAAELAPVRNAWKEAYNNKQLDKLGELYAEDAVLVGPPGVVKGKSNILNAYKQDMDAGVTVSAITPSESRVTGDTAYEVGTYEGARAGKPEKGSYLVVLKKIAGKWKLVAESGTPQFQMPPPK